MVASRACKGRNDKGEQCGAPPLRDGDFCLFHDPEHTETVQEARRAGGTRRKREVTLTTAYDLEPLTSVPAIRRLIEIAAVDALGLEANLGRVRVLGYIAQVAITLLEKGEQEERLAAVEAALGPRLVKSDGRRR